MDSIVMIHQLPQELIHEISLLLSQNDVLHLAYCSKALYSVIQPRLYYGITVNASHRAATSSRVTVPNQENQISLQTINTTSLFSLKLLFKNLMQFPQYCTYIKYLSFSCKIPDINDSQLLQYLDEIIPNCTNLVVFNWYNYNFDFPLALIRNCKLFHLNGNFDTSDLPSNKWNLSTLNLSSLCLDTKLDLSKFSNLKTLVLSKSKSATNDFRYHRVEQRVEPEYDPRLSTFINNIHPLTSLSFKNLNLTYNEQLYHPNLENLSIIDCVVDDEFLPLLSPHLTNLKHLNISLQNDDSNMALFRFLHHLQVISLNVTLNLSSLDDLNHSVYKLLMNVGNLEFLNLKYNIDPTISTTKCDTISLHSAFCTLSRMNLEYLNLSLPQYQFTCILPILRSLCKLNFLDLTLLGTDFDCPLATISSNNTLISQDLVDYYTVVESQEEVQLNQYKNYANDIKCGMPQLKSMVLGSELDRFYFEADGFGMRHRGDMR
jgi:hypothetical protein